MMGSSRVQITGLPFPVSRLCFGCEQLGGTDWGTFDERDALAAVDKAIDSGVNFFDTADVYGLGISEERLGRALGQHRNDVVVATKGGIRWTTMANGRAGTVTDCSPSHLRQAVTASLRRLNAERLLLYQLHRFDPAVPLEATLGELERLREEGLIAAVGYSNFPLSALRDAHRMLPASVVQVPLNLIDRQALEVIDFARDQGIAVLTYGPLAQGLLTGKYGAGTQFDTSDRRHRLSHFAPEALEHSRPLLDALGAIANERGQSISSVAIRWCLETPGVSSVIMGARSPEQVAANMRALTWMLSPDEYRRLNEAA